MPSFWSVFLSTRVFHNGRYFVGSDESYVSACDEIEHSIWSPKETCNLCHVRAKTSLSGSCTGHEDEDEDDKPLIRPTTRKEPLEEGRDQAVV